MLVFIINKLSKLLRSRELKIDPSVSGFYLLHLSMGYFTSLIRALPYRKPLFFLGKGSKIECANKVVLSKGVSIGRYTLLNGLGKEGLEIGGSTSIGDFGLIRVSGSLRDIGKYIRIGSNVGIGDFCHIGGAGGVYIGDDTIIGAYFSVHPENHNFSDQEPLIRSQGVSRKGINIGKNCWIGAKVTILDGVIIGDGCVIAAGAVVCAGDYPKNSVLAGVPAKVLSQR